MNEHNVDQQYGGFKLIEVVIIVVITCVFSVFAGISYGRIKYSDQVDINDKIDTKESSALEEFIKQYKNIINNYYDKSSINEEELLNAGLKSIVNKLGVSDPYSLYMDQETYDSVSVNLSGSYSGLGVIAYKDSDDDYIKVLEVIKNSPAANNNIEAGDIILSIDGKNTKEMKTNDFSQYVSKSKETNFSLKIKKGNKEYTINIQKQSIELESVGSKMYELDGKKIGYITLSIFASNSYSQFKKHLNDLEKKGIQALIIDVRDNTGGHLDAAAKIISLFTRKNAVIYQLQKGSNKVKYYSKGKNDATYPIVFISNEATASASEVLIISLKENLGAKLVGNKTYGKGTVQEMIQLSNGDKYKITTKKWLSPSGKWVNDTKGIAPDITISIDEKFISNPIEENDNQLKEALKLAKNEIK